ncbi:hypothetical protein FQN57_001574 [Myotisia sp. PD_48]|nr:hypothetical protein FQN57_001574 [Myotisia sp. PD_48]
MAWEALGNKLLGEIKEENLSLILRDARKKVLSTKNEAQSSIGIQPIDEILRALRSSHPVLEITSSGSADGKSSLLYYVAAIGILPQVLNGLRLGGKNGAVIYLDTDCRFSAERLRDICLHIIHETLHATENNNLPLPGNDDQSRLHALVEDCLQHVHVFRPKSSVSLLSTIESLESYLTNTASHFSSQRHVHAVLLDSASAFYWQDRREAELMTVPGMLSHDASAGNSNSTGPRPRPVMQLAKNTVRALLGFQQVFSCPIMYTVFGYHGSVGNIQPGQPSNSTTSYRPFLPPPWQSFPTLRFGVRCDPVRQFVPHLSLDEVKSEALSRQSIVNRGRYSGWIDPLVKEKWPSFTVDAINGLEGKGSFSFSATKQGVSFR